jgi:O-antigen/teichoic acid export membrane protein
MKLWSHLGSPKYWKWNVAVGHLAPALIFALGLFATFAGQLLLSRTADAYEFGIFILAYNAAAVLSGLGAAGFDLSSVRFVALFKSNAEPDRFAAFVRVAGQWTLMISTIAAAVFSIFFGWSTDASLALVVTGAAVTLCWSWSRVLGGVLRGAGKLAPALTVDRLSRDLLLFVVALAVFILGGSLSAFDAILTLFLGSVAGLCLGLLVSADLRGRRPPDGASVSSPVSPAPTRLWIHVSMGLMAYNLVELLSSRFDVFALSLLADPVVVGAFGLAVLMLNLIIIPASFITLLIMPRVAIAHDRNDHRQLRMLFAASSIAAIGAGLFISTLLWLIWPWLADFMPAAFTDHVSRTAVLTGLFVRSLCLFGTFPPVLLMMSGRHKALIAAYAASVVGRGAAYLIFLSIADADFAIAAFVGGFVMVMVINLMQVRSQLWPSLVVQEKDC